MNQKIRREVNHRITFWLGSEMAAWNGKMIYDLCYQIWIFCGRFENAILSTKTCPFYSKLLDGLWCPAKISRHLCIVYLPLAVQYCEYPNQGNYKSKPRPKTTEYQIKTEDPRKLNLKNNTGKNADSYNVAIV